MNDFMREAVWLARLGKGKTAPNPCVGAVIVLDNQVVARGWHTACGRAHAEVEAIRDAREKEIDLTRATLVVTLEPCNHQGKTPPCTKAILDARIPSVVIGAKDPNPDVSGGGIDYLRQNGVQVRTMDPDGICADLIADFRHWKNARTPYIYLKQAATLDGKIATRNGDSKWITGDLARSKVHELRSKVGAVLIGGNTFRADDPGLDCRRTGFCAAQPLAVVVTSKLPEMDSHFQLLSRRAGETIFWTNEELADGERADALRALGCRVWGLPASGPGIDLAHGFVRLRTELGVYYCLCEGGGRLAMSLLQAGLGNELWFFQAMRVLGDEQGKNCFSGENRQLMSETNNFRLAECRRLGNDLLLQLYPES
ncbi:MAG: bifunctional diaminohydroxyphosphoribosylaminopyrimidine deaminase/5-amino-6-(5-phosphoribosylamino)uracil reductase RibD [Thermodesulfobacteriota bacterium]